ncbi:MAG: hypothetical protein GY759_17150 [Chloroflexi bacterium]|nr:hypothetical protein [Chloroflexota bacterium]
MADGFGDRASYRSRLVANGDTHIDVYARAKHPAFRGLTINGYADQRGRLKELNDAGLKPVVWLTGEQRWKDYQDSPASQMAFLEHYIKANDDLVAGYVVGLELDEYWSADQVTAMVNKAKSLTGKPVGVHLTPGVGGHKRDRNYYRNADYIYLQFGDHLSGDLTADTQMALTMLKEALTLGIPVIANEYSLVSESAQAKALGDLLCANGAVGTGNGRNVVPCGHVAARDKDFLKKHGEALGLGVVALAGGFVIYKLMTAKDAPKNFSFDVIAQDTSVMGVMEYRAAPNLSVGVEVSENKSMGYFTIRF